MKKCILCLLLIISFGLCSCSFGTNDEMIIKEEFTILLKHVNEKKFGNKRNVFRKCKKFIITFRRKYI